MEKNHDRRCKEKAKFHVSEEVYIRNYLSHGEKWLAGIILEKLGNKSFLVHHETGQRKVHIDQIKKRLVNWGDVDDQILIRRQERQNNPKPCQKGKINSILVKSNNGTGRKEKMKIFLKWRKV